MNVFTKSLRPLAGSRRVRLDESGELTAALERAKSAERDVARLQRQVVEARAQLASMQAEREAMAAQLYQRAEEVSALAARPVEVVRVVRLPEPAPARRRQPRAMPVHPVAALVAILAARAGDVR